MEKQLTPHEPLNKTLLLTKSKEVWVMALIPRFRFVEYVYHCLLIPPLSEGGRELKGRRAALLRLRLRHST